MEDWLQKIRSDSVCLGNPYHFNFFKGCLSHILLGSFLNTLTQLMNRALCTILQGFVKATSKHITLLLLHVYYLFYEQTYRVASFACVWFVLRANISRCFFCKCMIYFTSKHITLLLLRVHDLFYEQTYHIASFACVWFVLRANISRCFFCMCMIFLTDF